jgi:glycosyltransferase involved in cell wall biosynthesis
MRILQVHNRYRQAGGEDAMVAKESTLLRRGGHEVIEHHIDNPSGALETLRALAAAPWNSVSAQDMVGAVERHRPDLVHVHNTWYALSPSVPAAAHKAGVPVVMTLHNYRLLCVNALFLRQGRPCEDCLGKVPWRGVVHRCYRNSAVLSAVAASTVTLARVGRARDHAVDCFIVPSSFVRDKMVAGGLPAGSILVKPHSVDDPGPRTQPPSASSTVLLVGRLSEEKGAAVVIEAWQRRRPRGMELLVVGDGPLRRDLERRAVPGVRFAGWLQAAEVAQLMLRARALVFPSICYEALPLAPLEALACGLPVLASGLGAPAEIVGCLGAEWLVAPGDPQAWAQALQRLDDPVAVDAAGVAGRTRYEAVYSTAANLQALERIYATVIGHRHAAKPFAEPSPLVQPQVSR